MGCEALKRSSPFGPDQREELGPTIMRRDSASPIGSTSIVDQSDDVEKSKRMR